MFRLVLFLMPLVLAVQGAALSAGASTVITELRTEYMKTPLGLDEPRPRFSWQMTSGRIGARQTAYRLLVATKADFAPEGLVYDSGTVYSDESLNVCYAGRALRGRTRYYWKVLVTDETGELRESETTWFETGLMNEGWGNARWIGSDAVGASRYRTFFNISYDVQIAEGSSSAVFAYSVKDSDNYITAGIELGRDGSAPVFNVDYCVEGERRHLAGIDLSGIITPENRHDRHSVTLKVSTPGYHLKSNLIAIVDGEMLLPSSDVSSGPAIENVSSGNPYQMVITPYPDGERVHDWARLHSIGFLQPEGQKARFFGITVSEDNWNTVLYTDPVEVHEVTGTGKLEVWEPYGLVSAPMLRRTLQIDKPLRSARLYVTARGIYEFYINGSRVGNDYFNPGWTDYRYRIMYNSYDVGGMLVQGSNGLGAMLGSGWYSDLNIFTSAYVDPYGISQSLLAKLVIEYEDGSSEVIVSDGSWKKYDHGPVVRNGFQFGEDYDARKEVDGWTEGDFDDSQWESADIFERPAAPVQIQAYVGLPIQNNITLTAVSVNEPVKGTYVYDFGQNVVGVPRLEGMKGREGQTVTLRFGEMVYPEIIPVDPVPPYTAETYRSMKGQVYIENYRGAISIDNYIMRGKEEGESYQPIFTDHGFRYVSISGLDGPLPLENVKAVVLESIGEATADFSSSDPEINRLFENILWGQRGNFQSVPTDCPQRDERQGWTGDAQVFARTATYFSPWVGPFYDRWLYSMRDNQNIDGSYFNYYPVTGRPPYGFENNNPGWMGWMEAGIIVPYQLYMQYGDLRLLERHYESMVRYMDYLDRQSEGYTQPNRGIGDHLALEFTNIGLTNTAYYAYDAWMMSRIAAALGKKEDSRKYAELYENIRKAFNLKYVREDGVTIAPGRDGGTVVVDTQTSYALPLCYGLFDESVREKAVQHLVDNIRGHGNTLTTGFIGTPCLNVALSENGRSDVAYTLFEQKSYPSWLYPVLQGATTMWERWNSYTIENGFGPVDMNSFNHYAYGAIGEWIYAHCLGIQRDEERPAYRHILLQPEIGGTLEYVEGGFESPYGRIESGWRRTRRGYVYTVTIPANTTASLTLQAPSIAAVKIVKGEEGVGPLRSLKGRVMAELKSGTYEFDVRL